MKKTIILLLVCISLSAFGTIRLPAVIGSNMVLQQKSSVALWGWGDPSEKIYVTNSWSNTVDSTTCSSFARWKLNINTPAAGGPYTITIKGWNTIVLENVMIGEVWVCSGQSNMEWSNSKDIQDEIATSQNNNIRFFHIPRSTSQYPQDNCTANWEVCGPNTLTWFSAVGYFFGKKLQKDLNVPIGLIESAWGGTPVETWAPAEVINNDAVTKEAASHLPATIWGPHLPGSIYNGMIAPVTNFKIAGTIWYQGEANTVNNWAYEKALTGMIGSWRKLWNTDFPFYLVQIAPYKYGKPFEGALVREQQANVLKYPKTGIVVISDLVDDINDIHPKNKHDVGLRLANLALSETYQQNIAGAKNPTFKSMQVDKNKAMIWFNDAPNGFMTKGNAKATEFYIAGADKVFQPADVKIEKDKITLTNKLVPNPVAVRFSFSNAGVSNLFSKEGSPVAPFRTDDWELDMVKEK